MTSQNSGRRSSSSSSNSGSGSGKKATAAAAASASTAKNNHRIIAQRVLMKEKDRNQLNGSSSNGILSLSQTSISSNCKTVFKSRTIPPPLLRIKANASSCEPSPLSTFLQSADDSSLFDSDIEIIDEYEESCRDPSKSARHSGTGEKNDEEPETSPMRKVRGSSKKETPLLQIFDGNVVISQELSIEEVQNLLSQINSKLQSQSSSVNSADFPNITFSKEENSDIEIILDDASSIETGKNEQIVLDKLPKVFADGSKSEEWIGGGGGGSGSKGKVLLKSVSVGNKVTDILDQPSTSTETNLLISFKAFNDRKQDKSSLEHDYSSSKIISSGDDVTSKEDEPMVEQVVVENADTELMQIELIEPVNATPAATSGSTNSVTTNSVTDKDGEPIKLPDNLESVPKAEHFPTQRHRWNTNEEIAAILISFDRHNEWQSKEVKIRPKSGSMLLYSRKKVRYRRDGYCWKKRKDGKTTREDHMKLKVQGTECIYGCYVHSAILPTFHRRCYWLLQNPDIVLVHYLNVPYPDDNKLAVIAPSLALWGDKKEWTKEELVSQLKPMCESATTSYHVYSEDEPDLNNELEISTAETVEAIVTQLMEKQRAARAATLTKQLECGCPDSTCADGKTCAHPMRRITAANVKQEPNSRLGQLDNNNQVSSTTGSGMVLTSTNNNGSHSTTIHHRVNRSERYHASQTHQSPLVLSLSQIQGGAGLSLSQIQGGTGLLILNSTATSANSSNHSASSVAMVTSFKCNPPANSTAAHQQPPLKQYHHPRNKIVLKQESMETNQSSCCRQEISSSNNSQHKIDEPKTGLQGISVASVAPFESNIFGRDKTELSKSLNSPVTPTKCMDTSENSAPANNILISNEGESNRAAASGGSGSSFYNETLDLSQEDIQRTLSANMPISDLTSQRRTSQHKSPSPATVITPDVMVSEMNPMELMDSPAAAVDDDVFVNLDAFDMLGDFPELEILDNSGNNSATVLVQDGAGTNAGETPKEVKDESSSSASNLRVDFREGSASITDYSPEWAYPEGGVKVLVTGPWYSSSSRYTVLFDSFPVPTSLVQSGVLRCFCPAHEVGLATVQVACEGFVISNTVMFEYKRPPTDDSIKLKEPKMEENENLLKFTLLQRLEAVDGRLQIKQEPGGGDMSDCAGLYHQGINFEERMVNYCQDMTSRPWSTEENKSDWATGQRGMTLLHLAASLGFARLVCALLHWRSENSSLLLEGEVDALSQDTDGFTPLMWACGRGHREVALVLYRWNHTALYIRNSSRQTALEYARAQGQGALADEIEKLEATREETNVTLLANTSNNLERSSQSDVTPTPSVSPSCSVISLNSSKSHDGVFLRPDPVSKTEYSKFKTLSLGLNIPERSTTPSPTLGLSGNRSQSEPQRLVKRSSVDSGIHLGSSQSDSLPSLRSSTRYRHSGGRETPKLSRFDRSMSLPSPVMCSSYESESRRMDFALCEVAAAEPENNSPVIDMENLSEDDTEVNSSQAGEEEVRVLTLAEQIIAAIPDRIKNESEEMQLDASPPGESLASDGLSDSLIEPLLDEPSSSYQHSEFNFEFSDHNYRYYDVGTPSSSLSPASSSCLHSPSPGFPLDSPSPPPTTQDFCEFFQATGSIFEKDFSNLTLSDREQRELYEAAKIIQKAYRSYKGRKKLEEDKERAAAILIQNYYRRYKQFAYFKQMTRAAMIIQNGFRSYCEHKRFKKSQEAAVCIQNYYRNYKEGDSKRTSRESTPSTGLKRTYSQRRQHQAACKIQQFMRQSKNKLQRERALAAEREKQDARQCSQVARPKSQSPDNSGPNNMS